MRILAMVLGAALLAQFGAAQAATFVVDTTQNSNAPNYKFCDAVDDSDCSFHGALERANATPELDIIAFNIPASTDSGCVSATGVCRVLLPNTGCSNQTDSFVVTQPVVIDGLTQPGASANTLSASSSGLDMQVKIELGRTSYCKSGLRFLRSATVKNVAINQFGSVGGQTLPFLNFAGSDGASEVFRVESSIIGRNADGSSDQGENGFIGNPIRISDCFQCLGSWRNEVHIGGELPAQRNWFVGGGPAIKIDASNVSPTLLGTEVTIQGNLFGTTKSGLAAGFGSTPGENWVDLSLGNDVRVQVGGNTSAVRNVFSTTIYPAIGPPPMAFSSYGTGMPNLFVQGNYFGLAVDGITPLQVQSAMYAVGGRTLAVSRAQVGGTGPGEANMFVALYPSVVIDSIGANTILANQFIGNLTGSTIQDAARQTGILNDPGDIDQPPNTNGPKQNWPEITAFSVTGSDLSLTYRVDSLPAHSTYPLTVEFFAADTNNATRLLGRDTYTAAEATLPKTIVLPQSASHGLSSDSMIIATANMANNGGVSSFSWAPVFLTFQGNAPATVNQPTPIKVRVQGVGPFRPSGQVEISHECCANAPKCTATLVPVASSPYRAEGTCDMTWGQIATGIVLRATYLDLHESFHSDAGSTPTNTRLIDVVAPLSVELFCDGFETVGGCD